MFLLFTSLQLENYLCSKNYVQNPRLPLQNYEITLHLTDLFIHTIVARRESRLVKTTKAVFIFMSDLQSSYVNAFIAISRYNKTSNYPGKSFDVLDSKLYVLCFFAVVYLFSAAARTMAAASGHRKSTLIELQEQTILEILQQTASVITEERL